MWQPRGGGTRPRTKQEPVAAASKLRRRRRRKQRWLRWAGGLGVGCEDGVGEQRHPAGPEAWGLVTGRTGPLTDGRSWRKALVRRMSQIPRSLCRGSLRKHWQARGSGEELARWTAGRGSWGHPQCRQGKGLGPPRRGRWPLRAEEQGACRSAG